MSNPEEAITFLNGALPSNLEPITLEEARNGASKLGSFTTPGVAQVVAVFATHPRENPIPRKELVEATGLSTPSVGRYVGFLVQIGAIEPREIIRTIRGVGRPAHAEAPLPLLDTLIEEIPEWKTAVEQKIIDTELDRVADELQLTRCEAVRHLIDLFEARVHADPPAETPTSI